MFFNFVFINLRFIRNKIFLLNDYVFEYNIDILVIIEIWFYDDNFDFYFCCDICFEGFLFSYVFRLFFEGGGVGLLVRR